MRVGRAAMIVGGGGIGALFLASCTFGTYQAPACVEADESHFQTTFVPATGAQQGLCDDDGAGFVDDGSSLIKLYDSECLGADANAGDCGGFRGAFPVCTSCLESKLADPAYGALITMPGSLDFVEDNVPGCLTLAATTDDDRDCAAKYQADFLCEVAACSTCGSYTNFQDCAKTADADVCKSYADTLATCFPNISKSAATTCGLVKNATFETEFLAIGMYICGKK